jgi:hypothetical protein
LDIARCGKIVSILQVAMLRTFPSSALRNGVFAHPTLAESRKNLFPKFDLEGRVPRLLVC